LAQQPQASRWAGTHFTCFTGAKVQIPTVEVRSFFLPRMSGGKHFSVSPQCGNSCLCVGGDGSVLLVLTLLALLVQKYKSTDSSGSVLQRKVHSALRTALLLSLLALLVQEYKY
jgi:hypothetical protein